jgi:hypothetical protein
LAERKDPMRKDTFEVIALQVNSSSLQMFPRELKVKVPSLNKVGKGKAPAKVGIPA